MANEQEPDVKIIERSEVTPAGDDEEIVESPDSSQDDTADEGTDKKKPESEETEESEDEADEAESDETEESEPAPTKIAAPEVSGQDGEIKRLPGETNKEFAYRLEITRLRREGRKERSGEILTAPPVIAKQEMSPEKKKVLEKYKPEEIATLREVFDVMADDMGFVKKDQLGATRYQEQATEVLDTFLEKHPEYMPANDPGNVLWDRFKQEYSLYKQPANPKDLKKVLEKVHKDVFGIQPAAALSKNDAAKEKIKVASHSGASRPAPSREGVKRASAPVQGLRTDMLKGFSDEEIADLTGAE